MNVKDTLFFIIGLQTFVIFVVLFFYRSKKLYINRYLSYFFMTICVEILMYFLHKTSTNPVLNYLPIRFDFLTLTLLFFYTTETTGIKISSKFRYYIPALIEVVVLTIACAMVIKDSTNHTLLLQFGFDLYFRILSSVYIIFFSVLIIKINLKHQKLLTIHFSNVKYKSLHWLTLFCLGCIILNVFRHLYYTFTIEKEFIGTVYCGLSLFLLYYTSIASLIQINITNVIPSQVTVEEEQKELERIIKEIRQDFSENKTFLNPNINLKIFSKKMGIPQRDVSKAINRMDNKNFSHYINYYRVEESKKLLVSEKFEKYSISAIADEVGFSSRASFYKNFKKIEGVSPMMYVKSVKI